MPNFISFERFQLFHFNQSIIIRIPKERETERERERGREGVVEAKE
jgi:hypothetical protein